MKLSTKVKDPESTLVEMTIEMSMAEYGPQGRLWVKIRTMRQAMQQVVEGEVPAEENDENPKNS